MFLNFMLHCDSIRVAGWLGHSEQSVLLQRLKYSLKIFRKVAKIRPTLL